MKNEEHVPGQLEEEVEAAEAAVEEVPSLEQEGEAVVAVAEAAEGAPRLAQVHIQVHIQVQQQGEAGEEAGEVEAKYEGIQHQSLVCRI